MPLRTETTVEYYFNKPYIYYCEHHDCLRVNESDTGDSILHNGITKEAINYFIECYIGYVLDNDELKDAFKEALEDKEAVEDE